MRSERAEGPRATKQKDRDNQDHTRTVSTRGCQLPSLLPPSKRSISFAKTRSSVTTDRWCSFWLRVFQLLAWFSSIFGESAFFEEKFSVPSLCQNMVVGYNRSVLFLLVKSFRIIYCFWLIFRESAFFGEKSSVPSVCQNVVVGYNRSMVFLLVKSFPITRVFFTNLWRIGVFWRKI